MKLWLAVNWAGNATAMRQFALNSGAAITGFGSLAFPPFTVASALFSTAAIGDTYLTTGWVDYFSMATLAAGVARELRRANWAPV
jgi:hypothetical protein